MNKNYECCICHEPIERNKRLVYQEFDGKETYGSFHNKYNYDFCDKCFRVFVSWIVRHKKDDEIKLGLEASFVKEK